MKVVYVICNNPVLQTAREISGISQDGCFSVSEIAAKTELSAEQVRKECQTLLEKNLCARLYFGGTVYLSDNERLCTILHKLTVGKEYEVLGIEADSYRLLDDQNDPVLFDPYSFEISDPTEPDFWNCEIGEDGERYCYPREWLKKNIIESFHDKTEAARQRFWADLRKYYPDTAKERRLQCLMR
ncbi:MAG: hypothetical protein GY749_07505 [Desulfobacteraceae bacterium]|nr:hypothetical protein [Desulfobacteraceae bacterium]